MLVQPRTGALRLIRQPDHALLCGALASAWRAPRLPVRTVIACALHDAPWMEEDRAPLYDPASGLPHDFTHHPAGRKRRFIEEGLGRLAAVDPEVGQLVAGHFATLADGTRPEGAVGWVRWLDLLSLALCLTPPGARLERLPAWIRGPLPAAPGAAEGTALDWLDGATARLSPWPLAPDRIEHAVPFRDLPEGPFPDSASLQHAWAAARPAAWPLVLVR